VEGFKNVDYDAPVPEPSTLIYLAPLITAFFFLRGKPRRDSAARFAGVALLAVCIGRAQALSDSVTEQLTAIYTVKQSFNDAEQKMSSSLAFAARLERGGLPESIASIV